MKAQNENKAEIAMSDEKADYENVLNTKLAALLKQYGLDAKPEQTIQGSRFRADIYIKYEGLIIICEAETGTRKGALKDAQNRVDQSIAEQIYFDAVIAITYPPNLKADDFDETTEIEFTKLLTGKDDFSQSTVHGLVGTIRQMPQDLGDPDTQAKLLNNALNKAASLLSNTQKTRLAETLDLPLTEKRNNKTVDKTGAAAKRGLMVILAAVMFHNRLDDHLVAQEPLYDARKPLDIHGNQQPFIDSWPPKTAQFCTKSGDPIGTFQDAWDLILAKDYRPIFELGLKSLNSVPHSLEWQNAVKIVAQAALRASRSTASLRHDLMGRIFHTLLDSARYDGSYYTSTSTAVLLAGLALHKTEIPDDLSEFRVVDPACGTGTLLMATAERIRDLRSLANKDGGAVNLIEDVLWGLDVNSTACHLAATTLGLLSPSTSFDKMNIALLPLDVTHGDNGKPSQARAGSLELLGAKGQEAQTQLIEEWHSSEQVETGRPLEIKANDFDLVIMNPPYTRDSLRHHQFSKPDLQTLKDREKKLMEGRSGHRSSGSTMFIDLGEHLCSLDNGVLAVVLPQAGAAGPSALAVRKLLAQWFHIEWVISSHDPKRICFSENTTISEILIVARRQPNVKPESRPPTRFVQLRYNSNQATDAALLVEALNTNSLDESDGTITEWPANRMVKGQWRPLSLTSDRLVRIANDVITGKLFKSTTLKQIAKVGPAGRRIRDTYTPQETADIYGRMALWKNNTKRVRSLCVKPDSYIHPKLSSNHLADSYWEQRSKLLLAVQPRLNTLSVVAVRLDQPVVGSGWVPIRPHETDPPPHICLEDHEKALAVWLNSTLGLVSLIYVTSPKIRERPVLSIDAMQSIPVPKFTAAQANQLANVFDERRDEELLPLGEAVTDPVRAQFDMAIADTLGVSRELLKETARELAMEPSVG